MGTSIPNTQSPADTILLRKGHVHVRIVVGSDVLHVLGYAAAIVPAQPTHMHLGVLVGLSMVNRLTVN